MVLMIIHLESLHLKIVFFKYFISQKKGIFFVSVKSKYSYTSSFTAPQIYPISDFFSRP